MALRFRLMLSAPLLAADSHVSRRLMCLKRDTVSLRLEKTLLKRFVSVDMWSTMCTFVG